MSAAQNSSRAIVLAVMLMFAAAIPCGAIAQQAASVPPKNAPAAASGLNNSTKSPAVPTSAKSAKDPLAEAEAAAAAAAAAPTTEEASPEQQLQRYLENEVSQKLTRSTEPGSEAPFEKRPFDSPQTESKTTGPASYANELTEGLCREALAHYTCKDASQYCLTSVRDDVHKYNVFYGTGYTDFYCKVGPTSLAITSHVWKKQIISLRYRAKGGCVEAEAGPTTCSSGQTLRYCRGGAASAKKK